MSNNLVFIGASIDGYIADKDGGIDWLDLVPNPNQNDMGYYSFLAGIDAIVMGRKSFETVLGFNIPWPYEKHVFVLSNTLREIPENLKSQVTLLKGSLLEILRVIHDKGYHNLYIDGGVTISKFLSEDLIDEMIISTIPILLGGGFPLFSELPNPLRFELIQSTTYLNQIVQNHYRRLK